LKPLLAVLFSLITTAVFAQSRHAVFIIVDGIPADLIEKLPTPGLDTIAGKNGYKRALVGGERNDYSQTPTISAVGYNSVLTGTWVNKHNVWGNYGKDIDSPNYHYKTIFRVVKDSDPGKQIGIFSSWLDNRTKLAGENLSATDNLKFDYKYDSVELDTITYPNDTTSMRMHDIDEAVVTHAADVIRQNGPDLSWVYLEFTDDMGHTFGDGPHYYDAIKNMDRQMSKIWQAVQFRQQNAKEDWLVIITTDHGRDSATGKDHGGQSDRERRGWIVTNAKNLNAHYRSDTISIVDIMPTIATFLGTKLQRDHLREVDGTSLVGNVGATNLRADVSGAKLKISWKNKMKYGKGSVWVATTNNFKTGAPDNYKLLGKVMLDKQQASFNLPNSENGFYKIVLETPYNTLNRWIVPATKIK
jgi:hypothetical protein